MVNDFLTINYKVLKVMVVHFIGTAPADCYQLSKCRRYVLKHESDNTCVWDRHIWSEVNVAPVTPANHYSTANVCEIFIFTIHSRHYRPAIFLFTILMHSVAH
jgi:hypothetical protein